MHTYFYFTYHMIFCLYISLQQNAKLLENKSHTLFCFESPVSNRYLVQGRNMENNLWGISVLHISISTAQGTGHPHRRIAWHKLHRLASSENRVPSTDSHSTSKAQLLSKSPRYQAVQGAPAAPGFAVKLIKDNIICPSHIPQRIFFVSSTSFLDQRQSSGIHCITNITSITWPFC